MLKKVFNLDNAFIKVNFTNGHFMGIKLDKNRQIAELTPDRATSSTFTEEGLTTSVR